jgi:hypothetical protein
MLQWMGISADLSGFHRFRRSLLSGFKTFLPLQDRLNGDVFERSGS